MTTVLELIKTTLYNEKSCNIPLQETLMNNYKLQPNRILGGILTCEYFC